ncbi:hypothetical protein WA026_019069 [Henosepilachna vigintioctopunctata]|uniref:Uncharacterized protein n=1 Tax=Henosepilachna vigintioctopunctata TaxID=420089 RepID=A0AAW1VAQ1_9CUCU
MITRTGTPKKTTVDTDYVNTLNVNVDADDPDLTNLRDLLQDHSNCSSPADSTCSNRSGSSTGRKRERSKNKKSRKDRSSPCSSTSSLD